MDSSSSSKPMIRSLRSAALRSCAGVSCDNSMPAESARCFGRAREIPLSARGRSSGRRNRGILTGGMRGVGLRSWADEKVDYDRGWRCGSGADWRCRLGLLAEPGADAQGEVGPAMLTPSHLVKRGTRPGSKIFRNKQLAVLGKNISDAARRSDQQAVIQESAHLISVRSR